MGNLVEGFKSMGIKFGDSRHKYVIRKLKWRLRFHGFFVEEKDEGFGLEVSTVPFTMLDEDEARWSIICNRFSFGGMAYLVECLDRNKGLDPKGYLSIDECVTYIVKGRRERIG